MLHSMTQQTQLAPPPYRRVDPFLQLLSDIKLVLWLIFTFLCIIMVCVGYEALVLFSTVREVHQLSGGM